MQEKVIITKTDEQGGISFFHLNLSVDESFFRELVAMYSLTAQQEAKAQGVHYLTYSNSEGKGLTWRTDSIRVKGYSPYIIINDLRSLESPSASSFPNDEAGAINELNLYGIKTSFADNTANSNFR